MFLFTDGQATTGVTNSAQLESILSMMLQNPVRPTIYTFGFGADYDSECLGAIAQAGQGQSSFIEDAESIAPALATALGGLMSMSAQNVELTFTPKVTHLSEGCLAHTSLRTPCANTDTCNSSAQHCMCMTSAWPLLMAASLRPAQGTTIHKLVLPSHCS